MQADIHAQACDVIESSALLICIFILEEKLHTGCALCRLGVEPYCRKSNMVYRGKYVSEVVSTTIGAVAPRRYYTYRWLRYS